MTEASTPPTEAEVRDFIEELTQFRASLSPRHQDMLGELTAAALGPAIAAEKAEVQGYTAVEIPTFIAIIPVLIGGDSKDKNGWVTEKCTK